jgi:hypothetical protein
MFCRERERLLEPHAAALAKNAELSPAVAHDMLLKFGD